MLKRITTCIAVAAIAACNNAEKEKQLTIPPAAQTTPAATDSSTEDEDYTKRNINLDAGQWDAFKAKYHIAGVKQEDQAVKGKFKGDGTVQTLYLIAPTPDTSAFQGCIGGCDSYIIAADNALPVLKVSSNLGGLVTNIGDIDGDGGDELMVYPDWWQSNWNAYMIYSFSQQSQKWSFLIAPVSIFANELEKNIRFVKPSAKKGFVKAYTSEMNDATLVNSYKDFPVLKQ